MAVVTLEGGQSAQALGGQTLTYIQQLIQQQIPGVPDGLVQTTLVNTAREFYTKSTAWRDQVGPYMISAGQPFVQLNPVDQNSRIQYVINAYMFPFNQSNQPQPLAVVVRPPVGGSPQQPSRYYMQRPDVLQFDPVPDKSYGKILYVYACLIPLPSATTLPDISYTHHLDGIMWGTMARLYFMPKRPWSNKELAAKFEKDYRREILLARDQAQRGYGSGDNPVRYPPFAGRGGSQILPRATG